MKIDKIVEIKKIKVVKPEPLLVLEYRCPVCSEYGGGQHYAELPVHLNDIKNREEGNRISSFDAVTDMCSHTRKYWEELTILYHDGEKALILVESVKDDDGKEDRDVIDMFLVYFD